MWKEGDKANIIGRKESTIYLPYKGPKSIEKENICLFDKYQYDVIITYR